MNARRWAALLWTAVGGVVLLLLLKSFVADVYRVDSGSMRPTLFGGRDRADAEEDAEHVLVLYGRDFEPERFDLVVIRSPDGTKPLVKRVVGLPFDQDLMIRGGDLFIGRKRLPPDAPRPEPVAVYDDRYLDPERHFERREDGSVSREGDAWLVRGGQPAPGSLLLYHPPLRDDYFDRRHRLVTGVIEVNDAVLELEFALDPSLAAEVLHFQLCEEGDTFEVTIATSAEGRASIRLVRRNARTLLERREPGSDAVPAREHLLAEKRVDLETGRWYRLSFANVDNHLRASCPELGVDLAHTYSENEPWPRSLPPGQLSLGARVRFGAEAGLARFRHVRILRDLYYTDDGAYGVPGGERPGESAPISLGPEDYFLLGDNSAVSTDSRHFGPLKASELFGRPLAVLWPRAHWIRAVRAP